MEHEIKKLLLTGGAGGGKSTTIYILKQKLEELGYIVIICSEAATDCMQDGITPAVLGLEAFQRELMKNILARERLRYEALCAAPGDKKVLIFDRSVHDAAAYMDPDDYASLLAEFELTVTNVRDQWCDGIIFLRSPAVDKPEVYTTQNNPTRRETLEEAALLDERSLGIWNGVPHLKIIDNSTDMEGKALRALQAAYRALGIPEPLEIERKFLVTGVDMSALLPNHQKIHIEQHYLESIVPGCVERVRKRGQNDQWTYYHTIKRDVRLSVRTEVERMISFEEYQTLLKRTDRLAAPITKVRHCFVWKNQYFELDIFNEIPLILLEVELTTEQEDVILPEIFETVEEVTDDPRYSNLGISRSIAITRVHA